MPKATVPKGAVRKQPHRKQPHRKVTVPKVPASKKFTTPKSHDAGTNAPKGATVETPTGL
ncbi:hypothetical protein [Microbispora hainanensis]|uniref:Uncharacterized protein n=1 Tax=Microbispora hainanensis TaxID=568844 RepID=A0A544XV79_9ACTN|nr:hypothetical protein [Microbispora hainanensis]TQS08401.1 hypothetical protein FLX08_38955 [Microbispora hainanensis]